MTETQETKYSYAIYDLKATGNVTASEVAEAIKTSLQEHTSNVKITEDIPPYPLPEKPSRFQLVNPFKGNSALTALAGSGVKMPACDGSLVYAQAANSNFVKHGEHTNFYTCLWQYQAGYRLDVITQFKISSGGIMNIGKELVRNIMGDSSQFIPRTVKTVKGKLAALNIKTELVDAYPKEFRDNIEQEN